MGFLQRFRQQIPLGVLSNLALVTAPLLFLQGKRVRANPKLPEAAGARKGRIGETEGPVTKLLVLGDSSAAGVGARNQDHSYVGYLAAALAKQGATPLEWQLVAKSGVTCAQLNEQLLRELPESKMDYVAIAIGVNNVLTWTSGQTWSKQLDVLDEIVLNKFGQAKVVYNGLPPMNKFSALPAPLRQVLGWRSQYLDRLLKQWCLEKAHRHYLPIIVDDEDDDQLLAEDGFHPSEKCYLRWAEVTASYMQDLKN